MENMKTVKVLPFFPPVVIGLVLVSPIALANSSFNSQTVNATWEIWSDTSPGGGGSVVATTDTQNITASDSVNPDFTGFHSSTGTDTELWDVDFNSDMITLTFTSILKQDDKHQYMYFSPMGFHFTDIENNLPDIVGVMVENTNLPFGFNPELVTYDRDNIWVDLNGSMCHFISMGSMPSCANPQSSTGHDNQITLKVAFSDSGTGGAVDKARIDALFDWAETEFPEYFPSQQTSEEISGYYARYYPGTENYLGTKDGRVYVFGTPFGGMLDVGDLESWLLEKGL